MESTAGKPSSHLVTLAQFACHYTNRSAAAVNWGFKASDEMCQIALVYTPGETTRHCEIVDSGVR